MASIAKLANSDLAFDFIRKRILSGAYAQGQRLLADALAKEIGVSRTPVFDALRKLEAEGLVVIRPDRQGVSVRELNFIEFCEMCQMRSILESGAAGMAAEFRTDADLHEMREAIAALAVLRQKVAADPDESPSLVAEVEREDIRFHLAVIAAAKNELLRKEILRLHLIKRVVTTPLPDGWISLDKVRRDARREESMAGHHEILEAITKRDSTAAKSAMERHLRVIIEQNIQAITRLEKAKTGKNPNEDYAIYRL